MLFRVSLYRLQLLDTQRLQREVLVEGLGAARTHLVEEVFLEGHLGGVDPFPQRIPPLTRIRSPTLSSELLLPPQRHSEPTEPDPVSARDSDRMPSL